MWAGSEVWTKRPDIFLQYSDGYEFKARCDTVVNWFKKFNIDFGTLYFNEPDQTGHKYGPETKEYDNKVTSFCLLKNLLFY